MNIKSELDKPIRLFKSLTVGMLVLSIIVALIISLMIIGVGEGIFIKFFFILIAGAVALIAAYDSDNGKNDQEKNEAAMKNGLAIIITLVIIEFALFFHATTYSKTVAISVVPGTTTDRESTGKRDGDGDLIYKDVVKKTVEFYNMETNNRLGFRRVDGLSEEKIKLYTTITGKEYYIDYFPFFTYSEEFRYIRD